MRFSPPRLNALLYDLGQDVLWSKAYRCPCRSSDSEAAAEGCVQCHGRGWVWADPVAGYVGLSGQKAQHDWQQFGEWENGDVVVTLPSDSPTYGLGDRDKVRFVNSSVAFSETLRRHQNDDPLPFTPITLDRAYWLDSAGAVVEGDLPTLNSDDTLTWAPGTTAPETGQQYTLSGRKVLDYFAACSSFHQDRAHHHGAPLPRKTVLRRFDVFGR